MIDLKEDLRQDILDHVSGAPIYVIDRAVVDGCRKFLNESLVWEEVQTLDAYADELIIFPNDNEKTCICSVRSVKGELGHEIPFTWYASKIHFKRSPNQKVNVTVALMNNRHKQFAEVPDWVFNQHTDAIVHASLHILNTQELKPWFNAESAAYHYNAYKTYLGEARIEKTPESVAMIPFS